MTLTDAGAIISIVAKSQKAYLRCHKALEIISKPLVTTWPCFTEAMYFSIKTGGLPRQRALWVLVTSGLLTFYNLSDTEVERTRVLMEQYRDMRMDMADASLVVAAETLGEARVFTTDSDFYVYRRYGREAFEVVP